MKRIVFALIAVVVLVSCGSVPMASPEADANAKMFAPPADKAGVYIYRTAKTAKNLIMPILINDEQVGATTKNTYLYKELAPGVYVFTGKSENKSTLELEVEQGKNYFIWQQVRPGVMKARNTIQLVDEEKGKAGVNQSNLTVTN